MFWTGIHKTFKSKSGATKLGLVQIKANGSTRIFLILSSLIITKFVMANDHVAIFFFFLQKICLKYKMVRSVCISVYVAS